MTIYVSRQAQYYSGMNVVEVELNGLDYSGPDMLVPKYDGEGQEYTDVREAVEAAISIVRAWRKDGAKCSISMGTTGGMGIETEATTFADARARAKKIWDNTPKCPMCNEPMQDEKWFADDWSGIEYCSEHCAQREAEYQAEEEYRLEQEELETQAEETV